MSRDDGESGGVPERPLLASAPEPSELRLVRRVLEPARRRWIGVAVAVGAPGLVTLVSLLADLDGKPGPITLLLIAVLFATFVGGFWNGLLAAGLSLVSLLYFFTPPPNSWAVTEDWWASVIGFGLGVVIVAVGTHRLTGSRTGLARTAASLEEARGELMALVQSSPLALLSFDRTGTVTMWSQAAEELFGWRSDEVVGGPVPFVPDERRDEYEARLARLRLGGVTRGLETVRRRKDGTLVDVRISAAPILDARGDVRGVMATLEDIGDEVRARRAVVARSTLYAALVPTMRPEELLERITRTLVPGVADAAVAFLIEDERRRSTVVYHDSPDLERLLRAFVERYPTAPEGEPPPESDLVARALVSGEPIVVERVSAEVLDGLSEDAEQRAGLEALGLQAILVAPLVARGRALGALTLLSTTAGRSFGPDETVLASELARMAALALDNALLYRQRSTVAWTLQESLLPPRLPELQTVDLAAYYEAASERLDVGGDFYDAVELEPGALVLLIGDVCGKGIRAAAATGLARHTLRAAALAGQSPAAMVRTLNEALLREYGGELFCTVAIARLRVDDAGATDLAVVCAGHPLPYLVAAGGRARPIGKPGSLVGVFESLDVHEAVLEAGPGDFVVLYTDGFADAFLDADRDVSDVVAGVAAGDATAAQAIASLRAGLTAHGNTRDDVAVLVARVTPRVAPLQDEAFGPHEERSGTSS